MAQIIAIIIFYLFAGFVVFVLIPTIIMQIVWMMPFVPTPMTIVNQGLDLAKLKPKDIVYDLGAGDGRSVMEAVRRHPKIKATGFEVAIGVWMIAQVRLLVSRSKARVLWQNFMNVDLSDADVVFVYLSPGFMRMLLPKFKAELKPGTRIISHAFKFPDRKPTKAVRCDKPGWGSKNLFLYIW